MDGYSDVIVGARSFDNGQIDEGRAYVFHGSASGLSPVYAWYAEGNQTGANFGGAVAAAGDVNGDGYGDVIVGAKFYNNGSTDEGAAWVYHGSAAGLSATPAWSAEGNVHEVEFGCAVSSAGDVNGDGYADVLVGSWRYPYGYPLEGRAFVYYGSQSGLSTVVNWAGSGGQADGLYGFAVSGAGDVNGDGYGDFLVGARDYDGGASTTGRVFAYYGSESGPFPGWVEDGPIAYARFGAAVSAAGDVNGDGYADIIIGAPDYANPDTNEGAVYVYHGSGSGLSPDPGWQIEGNSYSMHYGQSVSTAGDVNGDGYGDVIFGGSWNAHDDEGRALVFLGSATGLKSSAVWTAEGNQIDAFLGYSVSTAGDVNGDGYSDVIVGAPWYDAALLNEGRAMVYHGSPAGLSLSTGWYAEGNQDSAYYGHAVASAGDVNGDGYADVIVGANYYDNGEVDEGRAFVYHGSETGPSTGYDWISEGNQNYAQFGYSVSGAGDVNGDGYDDVVIGARGYDNGETNEGRVYVHHGSATGLSAPADWTVESDQAFAYLGYAVSAAGDVNGDGYGDVILGAPEYDNGQTDEGRTTVYHGSRSGLSTVADWSAEGNQATANFGVAVATAGDVNGDGYSDVLVGSDKYDNLQTDEGRAFAFYGSAGGLSATPGWTAESNQASANFGFSVASAGDYDGDGYSDVIVGAWNYDDPTGLVDAGRALAYRGSPSGLIVFANWTVEGSGAYENLGYAVSGAGDVNGDGFADVIIGARRHNGGQDNEGRALVFHGSAAGLSAAAPDWSVESNQAGAYFGSAVAGAGDVNGDGYADVLVGAQVYDNGNADEGRVWLYYGNGGRGLSLVPRQRSVTDIRPVAHLGASDSPDGFRLNLLGRTPFGVTRTKLEWEVKPLGTPFNGIESKVGVHWTPGDPAGVDLSEVETGLFDENVYHWRVRLRYDQGMTPYAQRSRWLTIPWNGWQEADLRTGDPAPAGRIPGQTGWAGQPMTIGKGDGARLVLTWDASCMDTDSDYAIYEGELGDFTTHESRYCSTGGETTRTFTPLAGDTYYIVVPMNPTREGSYGTDSNGLERPAGVGNCLPQQIGTCE